VCSLGWDGAEQGFEVWQSTRDGAGILTDADA
jgi:hypothetical protein